MSLGYDFSSPEPKAYVSISDRKPVVCRGRRHYRCRKLFIISFLEPQSLYYSNLVHAILG